MKGIKIKIYGWSDFKKWFWDRFCFPRRKQVVEWLDYYNDGVRGSLEGILLKYAGAKMNANDFELLNKALGEWDEDCKKMTEKVSLFKRNH